MISGISSVMTAGVSEGCILLSSLIWNYPRKGLCHSQQSGHQVVVALISELPEFTGNLVKLRSDRWISGNGPCLSSLET